MSKLTASQALQHPAYANIIRNFTPVRKGLVESISSEGSRCNISYEIHGTGPKKLVWVSGLGIGKWFWQRQTKEFGYTKGTEYSNLIFDNRGMGESDKPWMKYTMKMFAQDVLALVDHVGWTGERELHLIGVSLGGMIIQDLAPMIPNRIASLIFCSTTPRMIEMGGWVENLKQRLRLFVPEPLDWKVARMKESFISEEYANTPDHADEADEGTPLFATRGDRYVAEMAYLHCSPEYTFSGWFRQVLAIPGWQTSEEQLGHIADLVGRNRIMSMHGTADKAINIIGNEELVRGLGGAAGENGTGTGIKHVLLEGCGHIPQLEKQAEFNELIASFVETTQSLGSKG